MYARLLCWRSLLSRLTELILLGAGESSHHDRKLQRLKPVTLCCQDRWSPFILQQLLGCSVVRQPDRSRAIYTDLCEVRYQHGHRSADVKFGPREMGISQAFAFDSVSC